MYELELLSPAGDLEKLEIVFQYGADAAYLGGKLFNLRAFADNFTDSELEQAVKYAHNLHKKVFVTLNIIPHNAEIDLLPEYVKFLQRINVDGVIVSDLGVLSVVKENSELPIHVSTQASCTNWRAVKLWHDLGASRVVLAREIALNEIKQIKDKVPEMELEAFVHGAMCVSISGRCLLSSYFTGRDANKGTCTHPCRWQYYLVEEKRPGEYLPVFEDEQGTYILNSRDLCTIEFMDKLVHAGISSFKIEGRVKGIYYGAITTKIYREALNQCQQNSFKMQDWWMEELQSAGSRGFTSGFYQDSDTFKMQNYSSGQYKTDKMFVAKVIECQNSGEYLLNVRNHFTNTDIIELISPVGVPQQIKIPQFFNLKNNEWQNAVNPNDLVLIKPEIDFSLRVNDLLRIKVENT